MNKLIIFSNHASQARPGGPRAVASHRGDVKWRGRIAASGKPRGSAALSWKSPGRRTAGDVWMTFPVACPPGLLDGRGLESSPFNAPAG